MEMFAFARGRKLVGWGIHRAAGAVPMGGRSGQWTGLPESQPGIAVVQREYYRMFRDRGDMHINDGMTGDCHWVPTGNGRVYCPACDPEALRSVVGPHVRRNCGIRPRTPQRIELVAYDDYAFRLDICRRNQCGRCEKRGEQELCAATMTCRGRPLPIHQLCRTAPGCPEKHW